MAGSRAPSIRGHRMMRVISRRAASLGGGETRGSIAPSVAPRRESALEREGQSRGNLTALGQRGWFQADSRLRHGVTKRRSYARLSRWNGDGRYWARTSDPSLSSLGRAGQPCDNWPCWATIWATRTEIVHGKFVGTPQSRPGISARVEASKGRRRIGSPAPRRLGVRSAVHEYREPLQVQRPAFVAAHAFANAFPAVAVAL
jgi:hypothetical protein